MLANSPAIATSVAGHVRELPLGALTRDRDANFYKLPIAATTPVDYVPNPSLPTLFQKFAYYIDTQVAPASMLPSLKPKVRLYRDIYDHWISKYVVMNTSQPGALAYELVYDSSVLNTTSALLAAFKGSQTVLESDLQFMYVGLYLFVLWFFLVESVESARLNNRVKRYVATEGINWRYGNVSLDNSFFVSAAGTPFPTYQASFARGFAVKDRLKDMLDTNGLVPSIGSNVAAYLRNGSATERQQATLEFIKFFRLTLRNVVDEEYLDLLSLVDPAMPAKGDKLTLFAVGDGGSTLGLFDEQKLGTLLFHYELTWGPSSLSSKPIVPQQKRPTIPIWQGDWAIPPPSIFIAQFGAEDSRALEVTVEGGNWRTTNSLDLQSFLSSVFDSYLCSGGTRDWTYDSASAMLSFPRAGVCKVEVGCAKPFGQDIVFVLFPNTLAHPLPPVTLETLREEHLAFHQPFGDNMFVVPSIAFAGLWQSVADKATTKAILLRLRDNPNFILKARLSGGRVGLPTKSPAAGFGAAVESDLDQRDSNSAAPGDGAKRYGYGELAWWPKRDLQQNILEFVAQGFTSPLRCTWKTWAFFQQPITGSSPPKTKAAALEQDVGQYLRHSSPASTTSNPNPPSSPSYNTVLSAFRAMGMLEAMIRRLQARADELVPADLTSQQRDDLKIELEGFLQGVFVPVMQYLRDEETGIDVGYKAPDPNNRRPKTIFFSEYAY